MILIAENLNSSIPSVYQALEKRQDAVLAKLITRLDQSPADYLDVNAGLFHDREADVLAYLVKQVRRISKKPLVLDSPDPKVLERVCPLAGPGALLNSTTLDERRLMPLSDLAKSYSAGLIGLLMTEKTMPQTVDERLNIADQLLDRLSARGLLPQNIYLDPLIKPLSVDDQSAVDAYRTIAALKQQFPETKVIIGLSNISFGLPARQQINRAFLLQAMAHGLDSAIVNVLDQELLALVRAGFALSGQDEYCLGYLKAFRS